METKKPWQSKTLWANLILAACALVAPGISTFLQSSPEILVGVFTGLNLLLRLVTKGKISLE